ncbi:hypothetical protein [Streptomyces sp. NPDC006510]|uniref:hypothetical protein n=1 Tax=Streptomyces sp. NPDC006510 TaxID=3155600 RepID=UPI0033AA0575
MAMQLMVHMLAARERSLADGTHATHSGRPAYATGLVDAITGLWTAPVTPGR